MKILILKFPRYNLGMRDHPAYADCDAIARNLPKRLPKHKETSPWLDYPWHPVRPRPPARRPPVDEITQNGTAVPPYGPGSVMTHVPEASKHATGLNQYLRNHSSLPLKAAELAMLVAAREMDCQHIWKRPRGFGAGCRRARRRGGCHPGQDGPAGAGAGTSRR